MKKIKLLIVFSVLGLIALSIIQGYLIQNTYQLKKKAFIGETKQVVGKIDDYSEELDSLSDIWQTNFINNVVQYKTNQLSSTVLVNNLRQELDAQNKYFKDHIARELKRSEISYDIKYQKKINYIILLDSIKNDTLFNSKLQEKIRLGNDFDDSDAISLSNTLWQTDHTSTREVEGREVEVYLNLSFELEDLLEIKDWKKVVLGRMSTLLLLSGLIFLFVIGLLYFSIKNLMTQKKIAEIKTDFVNNITHELKTPLSTLSLATKVLHKELNFDASSNAVSTIKTIERQNKRLQSLIDQVLTNSLGYQEIKINLQKVEISQFLHTVLDDFSLSYSQSKKITISRHMKEDQSFVRLDPFYITTVLLNILENAVKYSGEKVEIQVSLEVADSVKISIQDNGIGISRKDKNQIFEKFYRIGNKEIHNVKGLGLGLYYAHQIVKAHQGKLHVDSDLGKGSTFNIENTYIEMDDKKHILLAEDDADFGSILKQYLEIHSYYVTWAKDGEAAFSMFQKDHYDICVLDVMMPKMDGFTLAERMIKINPETPFVFLTARKMKADKIKGLKLGADDYIAKPFEADELVLRLKNILKRTQGSKTETTGIQEIVSIGAYQFNPDRLELSYDKNIQRLTEKESELIQYLYITEISC